MKAGLVVKLTKLCETIDPGVRAGNWDSYVPGAWDNTASLPVDYVMIGILMEPPAVGGSVKLLRLERNGVPVLGVFESTRVVSVWDDGFATRNSVYRLERYERPSTGA